MNYSFILQDLKEHSAEAGDGPRSWVREMDRECHDLICAASWSLVSGFLLAVSFPRQD